MINLKKIKYNNINKLIKCALIRGGEDMQKKLSVNGQRTHTNVKTRKKIYYLKKKKYVF